MSPLQCWGYRHTQPRPAIYTGIWIRVLQPSQKALLPDGLSLQRGFDHLDPVYCFGAVSPGLPSLHLQIQIVRNRCMPCVHQHLRSVLQGGVFTWAAQSNGPGCRLKIISQVCTHISLFAWGEVYGSFISPLNLFFFFLSFSLIQIPGQKQLQGRIDLF